jgi:EAL domain-containing protein (putative c-di-GMP-specific phosphodiesterase class I)
VVLKDSQVDGLLAIDDFGTGYASLTCLRRFPIDAFKIDRKFVRDSTTDIDDPAIVAAVIGPGRRLRPRVIAEGAETREQLALLKSHFCDEGQGYHFSRPVIAAEPALSLDELPVPSFASTQVAALSDR